MISNWWQTTADTKGLTAYDFFDEIDQNPEVRDVYASALADNAHADHIDAVLLTAKCFYLHASWWISMTDPSRQQIYEEGCSALFDTEPAPIYKRIRKFQYTQKQSAIAWLRRTIRNAGSDKFRERSGDQLFDDTEHSTGLDDPLPVDRDAEWHDTLLGFLIRFARPRTSSLPGFRWWQPGPGPNAAQRIGDHELYRWAHRLVAAYVGPDSSQPWRPPDGWLSTHGPTLQESDLPSRVCTAYSNQSVADDKRRELRRARNENDFAEIWSETCSDDAPCTSCWSFAKGCETALERCSSEPLKKQILRALSAAHGVQENQLKPGRPSWLRSGLAAQQMLELGSNHQTWSKIASRAFAAADQLAGIGSPPPHQTHDATSVRYAETRERLLHHIGEVFERDA